MNGPAPIAPSRIFGFVPSGLSARQIAAKLAACPHPAARGVRLVVTANIDHVARLRHDAAFAAAYRSAAIVTCDGFPVLKYARLCGCAAPERVTGCDITASLLHEHVPGPAHALFFVTDSDETAARLLEWAARHGLAERTRVAVAPRGFQALPRQQMELARQIRDHGTTLLVMGIGAPRSEIFVHRHRHMLPPCWAVCVGQALRIEMGLVPRAPALWQRLNLEWLWRLGLEPRRLAMRYATAAFGFLLAIAAERGRETAFRILLASVAAGVLACVLAACSPAPARPAQAPPRPSPGRASHHAPCPLPPACRRRGGGAVHPHAGTEPAPDHPQ